MKNIKILTANDTVNDCLKIEPNKHSDTDLAWLTRVSRFTASMQKNCRKCITQLKHAERKMMRNCSELTRLWKKQIPISPSNKAYCRSCGSKLLGNGNYCPNCGQKLSWKGQEFDLLFDDLTDELSLIEIETSVPKVLIYPNLIYFKQ